MVSLFEGFCPPITGEPKGVNASIVTENRGSRCPKETVLNIHNNTRTLIYSFIKIILNTYLYIIVKHWQS